MTESNPSEQVTVTDKRRIDPETGEVRQVPPGNAPGGAPAAEPAAQAEGKVAEPVWLPCTRHSPSCQEKTRTNALRVQSQDTKTPWPEESTVIHPTAAFSDVYPEPLQLLIILLYSTGNLPRRPFSVHGLRYFGPPGGQQSITDRVD